MVKDDADEVRPSPYSKSDKPEHDAIHGLNYILGSSVKSHIESRDKDPNHDGWLELVDEDEISTGRIVAQVKKLPDRNRDTPKKQVKTSNLAYCKVCIEPFILIAVDVEDDIAYWRHITEEWFDKEGLNNQKTKVVHLTDRSQIAEGETDYIDEWQSIVDDTRRRVDDYDEHMKLLEQSNPAIGERREEFESIHNFLDQYHHLIDTDFHIIREKLFPRVWKFGYGNINYGDSTLRYTLYPIMYDENDAQIRDIDDTWDIINGLGGNIISGNNIANPISNSPKRYAYNAIEYRVSTLFDNMRLDYSRCTFAATEYVYDFVQSFAPLLGLQKEKQYQISDIRDGYYQHLQFWLSEVIENILKQHSAQDVVINLDGYMDGDFPAQEMQALSKAERAMEYIDEDPPRYRISMQNFDRETVERMIGVLVNSEKETIDKPYRDRDRDREEHDSHELLGLYSDEAIFENIQAYNEHYYREYRQLLNNNFPDLYDNISKGWTNFLVVTLNRSNLRGEQGWSHRWFWLDSDHKSLKVECKWSDEMQTPNDYIPDVGDTIEISGEEYEIVRHGMSATFRTIDRQVNERMVLSGISDELEQDIKSYISEHKYIHDNR